MPVVRSDRTEGHAKERIPAGETRGGELRRAAVLLACAVVAVLVIKPFGPAAYHWLPVLAGAALVLAALVGGRGSRFMGPGLPVLFWGIGIVITSHFHFTGDYTLTTGMIGLGAITAWALSDRGWPSNSFAVGGGVVFIGLGEFIHGTYGEWATFYIAMTLGLLVALEILSVRTDRRDRATVGSGATGETLVERSKPGRREVSTV